TADVFREGGTFHVLVISGLHITFIGGLALLFVRVFTDKKTWRFIIVCTFLWAFSIAVGAEVPVVRAALMFTILLFSGLIFRRGTLLNALGACALVLLVWRPNDLFTPSFQLTFQSVAALVVIAFPLLEKLKAIGEWTLSAETPAPPRVPMRLKGFCETVYWRENIWQIESKRNIWTANLFKSPYIKWTEHSVLQKIVRYVFEGVLVSLIVQLSLLPLMIIYFNRVSPSGILLNLWVGVVIALESFTAVFAVMLAQISGSLSFPFIKITEFFNRLLVSIPEFFVENSWASFRVPTYSFTPKAVYFLYFAPVLTLTILLFKWNPFALDFKSQNSKLNKRVFRFAVLSFSVLLALIVFHPFSAPVPDGRLQIDFLDVGQGDSALITFPNGEMMLVDGGGKIDFKARTVKREGEEAEIFEPDTQTIGETVVSRFLWEKGFDKVDYILATHADADHIQGLSDVAKNFRVRAAMFGRTPFERKEFAAVYSILQKRGSGREVVARRRFKFRQRKNRSSFSRKK
nr:ComEC/Rec2 family competence protein [Acidobacteriota bacterium]